MANFPNDNPLKVTAADEAKVRDMNHEQIKEFFKNKMVDEGLVERDYYDPSVLHATPQAQTAPAAQTLQRVVNVGDTAWTLTGADEAQLDSMELTLRKRLANGAQEPVEPQTQARDESGRFISAEDQAAANAALEADLSLKLRRGEITIAQYMKQSPEAAGMIDDHLKANYGVDREALRDRRYVSDWETAVSRWLNESEIGQRWEGGAQNRATIEKLLQENAEQFSDNTVEERIAALDAVAEFARENNMLVRNPEIELREATNFDDIRNKAHEASGMPPLYARLNSQWGDRR